MINDLLIVLGMLMALAGLGLFDWRLALVAAGLMLAVAGVVRGMSEQRAEK
jgi:hypothetical protein